MENLNIIIPNPTQLEGKIQTFKQAGKDSIHILTSFDKTLTKATFQGKKIVSFISKLRNGNYISKEYQEKAQELYNKYHPIEIFQTISQEEKNKSMKEWWTSHYNLLIDSGLNKETISKIIEDMIKDKDISLRDRVKEFLDITKRENIPIIIMSASGLGNVMVEFLKKQKALENNITFISNILEFNKEGKFTGIKDNRIIHTFNKNETELKSLSIYRELEKRKNVILMCDSLADLNMINGFNYNEIIKIAFYNNNEENLEQFKANFDIIITNDGSFDYVNEMMRKILE